MRNKRILIILISLIIILLICEIYLYLEMTYYQFAANFVQNLYSENMYSKELLQIV